MNGCPVCGRHRLDDDGTCNYCREDSMDPLVIDELCSTYRRDEEEES